MMAILDAFVFLCVVCAVLEILCRLGIKRILYGLLFLALFAIIVAVAANAIAHL
jgi:hypothetical protein